MDELESSEEKFRIGRLSGVFWIILILGVGFVVFFLLRPEGKLVIRHPEAFQAVFLDNSQVYFGKLRSLDKNFLSLTDVYYLRAGSVQKTGPDSSGGQIDLVKLGSEIHAPRDEMIVSRQHVVFYEEVGENSEVAKIIEKSKGSN